MLNENITTVVAIFLSVFLSVQFGALLIILGSIIYAPTGNRIGKYFLILGLFIFTLNNFIIGL